MKVLLVNSSPHKNGCIYTALEEIAQTLNEEGIVSEIFQIGLNAAPCRACGACTKLKRCVINDDRVNDFLDIAEKCDGFIIGSPVHYASASGLITSFMDRAFYAAARSGRNIFRHKPGTAIASARRAGTTATLDQLNKYFTISQMPIISGRYWNMIHGNTPEEVIQDKEGMQNMRIVARNMAWHLKCREAAEKAGILPPQTEEVIYTNFIR